MSVVHVGMMALALLAAEPAERSGDFDSAAVGRFAELALTCVHQEYPNKIGHVLNSADDARTPRELTPVFLRLFRLALGGSWALAAGAVVSGLPGRSVCAARPCRSGGELRARAGLGGGCVSARRGEEVVRASPMGWPG